MLKKMMIVAETLLAARAAAAENVPEMRMTPAEMQASALDNTRYFDPANEPGARKQE